MKLKFDDVRHDRCQPSIDVLRQRCDEFFLKRGVDSVWYPDHHEPAKNKDVLDVVFFGNFVRRFLDSGQWMQPQFRLWCISHAVKCIMTRLMGLPADCIGVIPREELFTTKPAAWPDIHQPWTCVVAGRISPTKNTELVLRTILELQTRYQIPVSLVLSGTFDNQSHPDRGRWLVGDYERTVKTWIREWDWVVPPKVVENLNSSDWTQQNYHHPVYLSLSTYAFEDFGVSLAQAQSQGWPALVSDWGGHADANGAVQIPAALLGHEHEGSVLTQLRAVNLAAWLIQNWKRTQTRVSDELREPKPLSLSEVDHLRRQFLAALGPDSHQLGREGFDGFSYTKTGERFLSEYRDAFSGSALKNAVIVLVNDFNESQRALSAHVNQICLQTVEKSAIERETVAFVSLREIFHGSGFSLVSRAKVVVVPFDPSALKHLLPWLSQFPCKVKIAPLTFFENSRPEGEL